MSTASNDPSVLLDTSKPFDKDKVRLLDDVVKVMYSGASQDRTMAHQVLSELKAKPEAWRLVNEILLFSVEANTKFFALAILESCIQSRWKILPEEQKNCIKQSVTQMAVECAGKPKAEKHLVAKVNETLVQIVKQDWPHSWPSFIPDMCTAARTNQQLCENVMRILCILSEEVFEFGEDEMTSKKVRSLMMSMTSQFQQIYELCMFIIQNYVNSPTSLSTSLLSTTLNCLCHFLKWIPYGFIFQTGLIDILLDNFWDPPAFRIECICCLAEISSLKDVTVDSSEAGELEEMRQMQLSRLRDMWPKLLTKVTSLPEMTLNYEENVPPNSRMFWESLYQQLAVCLTAFLKNHLQSVCEEASKTDHQGLDYLLNVLTLLLKMSRIQHDATFKICLDYWHHFTETLLAEVQTNYRASNPSLAASVDLPKNDLAPGRATDIFMQLAAQQTPGGGMLNANGVSGAAGGDVSLKSLAATLEPIDNPQLFSTRLQMYESILDELRRVLVSRMAKPQEVYVNYDEETQTVDRDYQPDTDEIALYNTMRETQIYLANLGGHNTQKIMEAVLVAEIADRELPSASSEAWNPMMLNRLCWSIGAISGSMSATRERAFLIKVIKELLTLCQAIRGKPNKAIVASQLMYIIGQYPRFLNIHWKFLSVLIDKLFQFMSDTFPGVQDMACETFLKVCQKCKVKIASPPDAQMASPSSSSPTVALSLPPSTTHSYIDQLIGRVHELQNVLENTKQRLMLYEAVAHCISATDPPSQVHYIDQQLLICNQTWLSIIQQASNDVQSLLSLPVSKRLTEILRINERVASATGSSFSTQLKRIYDDMLRIYSLYSTRISAEVTRLGPEVMGHAQIKQMRSVKRESLRLVETFVNQSAAEGPLVRLEIGRHILPPLLRPVLEDYRDNVSQAKDFEVLLLLSTLIKRFDSSQMKGEVSVIFDCVFDCTLEMIKHDFNSFPDIRAHFYDFLQVCTTHCFDSLFNLEEERLLNLVESFFWAFKHEQPAIADRGLATTFRFLKNLIDTKSDYVTPFFATYYYSLMKEIVSVLTDTLHKAGFRNQSLILQQLIKVVDSGLVDHPSSGVTKNVVREKLALLLLNNFPNLNTKQVEAFVLDIFNSCDDSAKFQRLIRDFLVQLKEFAGADDLFEAEREEAVERAKQREDARLMLVPGMMPQWEVSALDSLRDDD